MAQTFFPMLNLVLSHNGHFGLGGGGASGGGLRPLLRPLLLRCTALLILRCREGKMRGCGPRKHVTIPRVFLGGGVAFMGGGSSCGAVGIIRSKECPAIAGPAVSAFSCGAAL